MQRRPNKTHCLANSTETPLRAAPQGRQISDSPSNCRAGLRRMVAHLVKPISSRWQCDEKEPKTNIGPRPGTWARPAESHPAV